MKLSRARDMFFLEAASCGAASTGDSLGWRAGAKGGSMKLDEAANWASRGPTACRRPNGVL
jgi:hypothetical protein